MEKQQMSILGPYGKGIYKMLKEHCKQNNILQDVDDLTLVKAAHWEEIFHENALYCKREGHFQVTQSGYSQMNAQAIMMQKAQEMVLKLSANLGLSPMDRKKLGCEPMDPNDDLNGMIK